MSPTETLLDSFNVMLAELEPYLLSPELFWPISSRNRATPQDRLTIGNLLLHLDRMKSSGESLSSGFETRLRKSEMAWESAFEKWKSAITKKASAEISSRLNLWQAYLTDLEEGQGAAFNYHHEVRNRVIVERLSELLDELEVWDEDVKACDNLLRSLVVSTDFIWPSPLQTAYPEERYWYLYRKPRKMD